MIEVKNVSRCFGDFRAVDGISFSIQTGEIVGLLGPNGAGKTTTMRMIAGYLEPTSGCVEVDGLDVTVNGVQTKAKIGYMPESAPLYSDMIVYDYLCYIADTLGKDKKEKVPELARICGLKDQMHKNIGDLSRGNRQRVGLAHALMGDPEILILDEPTSGLDPNQVSEVRSLIREIGKTRTVIISTHILSEVEMLCNRVIIISGGKKVADSPTALLRQSYGQKAAVVLTVGGPSAEDAKSALETLPFVASCLTVMEDGKVNAVISLDEASASLKAGEDVRPSVALFVFDRKWDLYSLDLAKNSLEDVFRTLTTGGESNV